MSDHVQVYVGSVAHVPGRGVVLITKVNAELPWPLVGKTLTFEEVLYRIGAVEWMRPFNLDRPRVGDRIGLVVRPVVVKQESVMMKLSDTKAVWELYAAREEYAGVIEMTRSNASHRFSVALCSVVSNNAGIRGAAAAGVEAYCREKMNEIDAKLAALGVDVQG